MTNVYINAILYKKVVTIYNNTIFLDRVTLCNMFCHFSIYRCITANISNNSRVVIDFFVSDFVLVLKFNSIQFNSIQFNSIYFKTHTIKKQAIQIQIICNMVRMKYN